jgi:DNA-binding transcriptional regulator WhiA
MEKFGINREWYMNNVSILDFYKLCGLRYNHDLLRDVAIVAEYMMHKNYCNMVNCDKIRKIYSLQEWTRIVYTEGDLIFIPFNIASICKIKKISDITVESDHHSFIGGNGFAVSNCAMGKQALGIYASNFNKRIDTMGNILNYAQKPLVYTKLSKYVYTNELPSGTNTIVAIMTHTGFNQEDSVIVNQSALDRGLFTSTYYKSVKDQCSKNHSTGEEEIFVNPAKCNAASPKPFSYSKLDEHGFVPKNTYVNGSDIVIGKVMPKKINGVIVNQDSSMALKPNDDGYVDMNYIGTNSEGYNFCNVRIRKNRMPQVGDKLACYSPDHEYLTTVGWVPVAELTMEHKVASMVNGKLVYKNPLDLYEFDHDGKMYELKSNQIDVCVTPNHRMLVRGKHTGALWHMKKAEEIYHSRFKMKKDVDNWTPDYNEMPEDIMKYFVIDDAVITHFQLDDVKIDIDDWLIMYGIYIAEGSVSNKYIVSIAANKPRVQEALDKIAAKKQVKITTILDKGEYIKRHYVSQEIAAHLDEEHLIAITKYLKPWVWWLNREQCKTLIKGMCLGDGGMMENGTWRYYTSSDRLADEFQRLCLHAGFSCNKKLKTPKGTRNRSLEELNKRKKEEKGQENVEIVESYTHADYWVLTIIESQNEPVINKNMVSEKHPKYAEYEFQDNWIDYKGKVYCCNVGEEGIIYVRRHGTPFWCGNSRSAQKGTIGMVYKHQDMPFTKSGIVPDIIMNPHAIPSRMTMAQLMECIMGKACCHIGSCGDATPFSDCSVESIAKVLELSGMERYGNEIMYNGRTGEQIQTEIFIGPTYYQRLKHMVLDKIHCVTPDHEVLTSECWKKISEVTMNDMVAILKDGKLVYEHPLQIHHYPDFKGMMYRIKNQAIDLDVTANHRMYIKTPHTRKQIWSDYRLEKAEDIMGKHVKYKKNAEWDAPNYQFILPAIAGYSQIKVDMHAWITFFGIWMAEGWAHNGNTKKYRVNISINKNRVKEVLFDAVNSLGFQYITYNNKLEINHKQLHAYMAPLSVGAPNKRLPSWVWKLSQDQAQKLILAIQLGDGSFSKNGTSSMYYTSSVLLADDFMRLCLHAGWSGMKSLHIPAKSSEVHIDGRKVVNNHDVWRVSVIKTKNEPSVNHAHCKSQKVQEEEMYYYEGSVYCLSVSTEVFMIRRNGKSVWTGNSRGSNGPIVMLTRQPSEGRSKAGGLRLGEMERDCLIGHGISEFLKEKMLDTSDNYRIFVCKNCGLLCDANPNKNIYKCSYCKTCDVTQVRIPYSFKLLSQELYCMSIKMGYHCA